ncbi:MAG: thiamine pyrophosphate-binding protein [Planctomycetes bacterium]|nr:thiamine pyrophosphate-binding protein [Planctomycetota bacterium]
MAIRGGDLVVRALLDEGVRFTFGIPGTHNIELYDALERSEKITPVLVTDEQSASFMADAVSRTTSQVGVANVVPGAGVTHCLSGVAEAFMDNVPLVVLTCGIRTDTGKAYQLHDIDQLELLRPIVKGTFKPTRGEEIYPLVRRAFALARSGTPGPVAVEIPANLYLLVHAIEEQRDGDPAWAAPPPTAPPALAPADVEAAARRFNDARFPVLYLGAGAAGAAALARAVAEKRGCPVATTFSGKGVFPETHPLWLWPGFGAATPGFVRTVMQRCDALLAIGCRFGEVATASYGCKPPANLIHVDINRDVFHKNYPAALAIAADAGAFLRALLPLVTSAPRDGALEAEIAGGHRRVLDDWAGDPSPDRVSPAALFAALQQAARPGAIYATDSGNGTFLAMEHLRLDRPGCFIGPVDYSCMGYSVPAAIGAKFANPERDVIALAGDGALLMTGLELLTAAAYGVAPVVVVLRDGELGQIAQFQRTSLARDTCSVLHPYSTENFARAVNAEFLRVATDRDLGTAIPRAFELAREKKPVVVEAAIDYRRKTYFTKGVVSTNLWRLPLGDRMRVLTRAAGRHLAGLLPGARGK